jgi:hypothetical protein
MTDIVDTLRAADTFLGEIAADEIERMRDLAQKRDQGMLHLIEKIERLRAAIAAMAEHIHDNDEGGALRIAVTALKENADG